MQFVVAGYDGTDEGALERRMVARDKHIELVETMKREGKFLFAAAILNGEEKMIGSILIVDFPSKEELDKWLEVEPYVTGEVWQSIEIKPCKVPQMFSK